MMAEALALFDKVGKNLDQLTYLKSGQVHNKQIEVLDDFHLYAQLALLFSKTHLEITGIIRGRFLLEN